MTKPYDEKRRLDQVRYSLQELKEDTGVGTHEVQDRMVDFGIQSYWMSHHPFIVPEPFTPEPCETYSREDLDYWATVIEQACEEAYADPAEGAGGAALQLHRQDEAHRGPRGAGRVGHDLAGVPAEDQGVARSGRPSRRRATQEIRDTVAKRTPDYTKKVRHEKPRRQPAGPGRPAAGRGGRPDVSPVPKSTVVSTFVGLAAGVGVYLYIFIAFRPGGADLLASACGLVDNVSLVGVMALYVMVIQRNTPCRA